MSLPLMPTISHEITIDLMPFLLSQGVNVVDDIWWEPFMHDLFKIKEVSEIHGAGPAHDSRTFVTLLFIPNGVSPNHRLNDVRDAIETLWRKFKKQNAPIHTETSPL